MAPDASSVSNGKKLSSRKNWKTLGYKGTALWGECQGSALYQVRVDMSTLAVNCSCPSRKQPCKHGLGLLFVAVNTPAEIVESDLPEWVTSWLEKRAAKAQANDAPVPVKKTKSTSSKATEKREALVLQGLDRLDLWLHDLIRNGLASVETQSYAYWDTMARQMVDHQAPGLASRIRWMSETVRASSDWLEKLLVQCGQLALLSQSYRNLSQLPVSLQEDVRQLIGWNLTEDEVRERGEKVRDNWLLLGQVLEETDKGRLQYVWLYGESSQRTAMMMQFAPKGFAAVFPQQIPLGVRQQLELTYWPGAAPQRVLLSKEQPEFQLIAERLPGLHSFEAFFTDVAERLARQPWQRQFLCVLRDVVPFYAGQHWLLVDSDQQALPLSKKGTHWRLTALSGGHPVDFAGVWDGETLLPLGAMADGKYYQVQVER
jgi:hypothetical protein